MANVLEDGENMILLGFLVCVCYLVWTLLDFLPSTDKAAQTLSTWQEFLRTGGMTDGEHGNWVNGVNELGVSGGGAGGGGGEAF